MTINENLAQKFGKVAVLFGGNSAEREVSLRSGNAVLNALLDAGCDAHAFDPAKKPLLDISSEQFERAFIVLHGRGGEDGTIQGALEFLNVPYTGSRVLGSALCMDKVRSKQIFESSGLPTASYRVLKPGDFSESDLPGILQGLGGTVMVKPALEGSSIGMTKVTNANEFMGALDLAFKYDKRVLVEQFIQGKEYTISMLNGKALPSIRMITPRVFYDYQAKYEADTTEYHCPSGATEAEETQLAGIAEQAFTALGASGWGRVDFMQSTTGEFFILEVNTVPGMTEKSLVPMAAKQAGLNFQELCLAVLETSLQSGA